MRYGYSLFKACTAQLFSFENIVQRLLTVFKSAVFIKDPDEFFNKLNLFVALTGTVISLLSSKSINPS